MIHFPNHRMTTRSAVARLAMIATMLICAVTCVAIGPQAFHGGAIALMLLGVSIGMIVPTFDDRGWLRVIGTLPDIVIVSLMWWLAYVYLLAYSGGSGSLGIVLVSAFFVYLVITFAIRSSLKSSSSLRAFACLVTREDGEPVDASESSI